VNGAVLGKKIEVPVIVTIGCFVIYIKYKLNYNVLRYEKTSILVVLNYSPQKVKNCKTIFVD